MAELVPFNRSEASPAAAKPDQSTAPGVSGVAAGLLRREFTSEEVSEIIGVALRKTGGDGASRVSLEEMLAIGREFGLTENDLSGALDSIAQSREGENRTKAMRLAFRVHVLVFGVINLGLFLINWMADPTFWWFVFPLIATGVLLALHAILLKYLPPLIASMRPEAIHASRPMRGGRPATLAESSRVTFTIPDVYSDLAVVRGLAQLRDDVLELEFEIEDAIFGALRSGAREVSVPVTELASVRLERWMVWTTLKIQGRRLKTFQRVPGHKGNTIKLQIDRQAQEAALELASRLSALIEQA